MSYFDRTQAVHVDGSAMFKNNADEKSENEIAELLKKAWGCDCFSFGLLSPIDWYFVRDGRVTGLGELKTRSHESTKFETVFLNARKWLALTLGEAGMGVPAVFIVRFTDGVKFIRVSAIDAKRLRIGGCAKLVKSRNDIEPVIEVPITDMSTIKTA